MVDTVGNRTGPRATFVYVDDGGNPFNIRLDESVAEAVGNARSSQPLLPVLRASGSFPLKPRYYRVQLNSDPRVTKSVIACNPEAINWINNAAFGITINSQPYTITARIGEQRFALKVDAAPD